jgi:hypothetical protein
MLAFSVLLETDCVLRYFSPLRLWNSERFWPRFFALHHSEFSLEIQPGNSAWDFSLQPECWFASDSGDPVRRL